MQVTIEITEEEYEQVEKHTRRAIVMGLTGMSAPTIADKMLGKLCMAVGKKAREAQRSSKTQEATSDLP